MSSILHQSLAKLLGSFGVRVSFRFHDFEIVYELFNIFFLRRELLISLANCIPESGHLLVEVTLSLRNINTQINPISDHMARYERITVEPMDGANTVEPMDGANTVEPMDGANTVEPMDGANTVEPR